MLRRIPQLIAGLLQFRISDTFHGVLFSKHFRRLLGRTVLLLVVRSSPPAGPAARPSVLAGAAHCWAGNFLVDRTEDEAVLDLADGHVSKLQRDLKVRD
jgi:hypothetical protein